MIIVELTSIKSVFIYLRKSRDVEGEGIAVLDNHKKVLLKLCKTNNWKDVTVFEEVGSGSSIEARPVFQDMLTQIGEGMSDLVLVMDLDRLSRGSGGDWERVKAVFRGSATFCMTATGQLYDYSNIDNVFMSDLLSVFSAYELQTIKKRYARGRKAAHAKGCWISGTPPYGYVYNRDSKHLDVVPEQSEVYMLMKEKALAGYSGGDISRELNSMGIKSNKGTRFTPTAVFRILTNPTYKGEIVFRKSTGSHQHGTHKVLPEHLWEVVKDTHPALITYEEFDRIRDLYASRNITPVNARRGQHALSGIVCCSKCGKVRSVTKAQNGQLSAYIKPCRTKGCRNGGTVSQVVIVGVNNEVKNLLENINERKTDIIGRTKELGIKVKAAKKRIKDTEQALDRIVDLYADGLIRTKAQFQQKQAALDSELQAAKFDLEEAEGKLQGSRGEDIDDYTKKLQRFTEAWGNDEVPTREKNRLAKLIINRVHLEVAGKKMGISVEFK